MYQKPMPVVGQTYKYSNKKSKNSYSGKPCKVLIMSHISAAVHNCLIEFEDGYKMITSKWNLF